MTARNPFHKLIDSMLNGIPGWLAEDADFKHLDPKEIVAIVSFLCECWLGYLPKTGSSCEPDRQG